MHPPEGQSRLMCAASMHSIINSFRSSAQQSFPRPASFNGGVCRAESTDSKPSPPILGLDEVPAGTVLLLLPLSIRANQWLRAGRIGRGSMPLWMEINQNRIALALCDCRPCLSAAASGSRRRSPLMGSMYRYLAALSLHIEPILGAVTAGPQPLEAHRRAPAGHQT